MVNLQPETIMVAIIAAIALAGIVGLYIKQKKAGKKFSPVEFLETNKDVFKDLFKLTLDAYKLDRTQYKSDDDYYDAIASMVYREIELEGEAIFGYTFHLVPKDVLIDFISDLLEGDFKHLLTYEKTDEIAEDHATETVIPEELPKEEKVDIFKMMGD